LISRAWLAPSRRFLYRSITEAYNNERRGPLLWDTIHKCPHVRKYIRRIYLRSQFAASHFRSIVTLLPHCTVLITLPSAWINAFFAHDNPGYLRIEQGQSYSVEQWTSGFKNWSKLRVLELVGAQHSLSLDDSPLEETDYLPSLRVLKLRSIDGEISIPPTTPNTLHTLVFSGRLRNGIEPACTALLDRHASSLRHFSAEISSGTRSVIDYAARTLGSLEILVGHGGYLPDTILRQLSSSIVHISIRIELNRRTYNYCYTYLIKNKIAHPELRTVELFVPNEGPISVKREWSRMARIAGKKRMQLLIKSDVEDLQFLPPWA
jgi:hypothetical protein